jgi:putative heme-binding domain-containing protein
MFFRSLGFLVLAAVSLDAREPWTGSRIQGSPEPAKPFVVEEIWKQHSFTEALEIVGLPGRVLVVENLGKVWSIGRGYDSMEERHLVVDLKAKHAKLDHLYGLALHPKWRETKEVFLTYTLGAGVEDGTKLARFRLSSIDPMVIDPASEEPLLSWLSGGHNGAHLQFGPDGMLYITTGDAEVPAPPDPRNTGQDNSDLLSNVLRIDVDRRDAGLNYAVPADNPFVGQAGVRPEIWAFGLRNPWKISFDSKGRLWCGDVGWELWEMIHLIGRGTNHGWSAMEATQTVKPELLNPVAPITPPIVAHSHTEAASITGGYVYHGKALPELDGAYVYGDYETGKIWALWHDGTKITRHEEIADTPHKIVTFGLLNDGEIVYAHWGKPSTFHRLVRNPAAGAPVRFPRKLSETGLFADVKRQVPATGVQEFSVTEPMWQDGLVGRRFVALPDETKIEASVSKKPDGSVKASKMVWPKDAVLAKTLSSPEASSRRIETQVLHFDGETWNGYSYRWNDDQTDAELVGVNGEEREVELLVGGRSGEGEGGIEARVAANASKVIQHRFHARAECGRCHTPWTGFALGFQPQQLAEISGRPARESALGLGLVNEVFFEMSASRTVSSEDPEGDLEARARSWLHANCAHCHRQNGGGSVAIKVNLELPLEETELVGEKPLRGDMGLADARLIDPGAPWRSAVLARVARTGAGRMPIIGSHEVDERGYQLLWQWISEMGKRTSATGETMRAEAPEGAVDSVSEALQILAKPEAKLIERALTSTDPNIAPLFERFLPPEKRRKVVGLTPDGPQLLSLTGDAKRGLAMLTPTGSLATCLACHFVNGTGRDFGPDLSKVGSRATKAQLLESLLHPSRQIAQGYAAYAAELKDGSVQVGFAVKQGEDETVLKLATGQSVTLRTAEVKELKLLPNSLMPEGLMQSLTAMEIADLLAALESLR